jgi:hypothetical protein
VVGRFAAQQPFTQESLVVFVDVIKCVRGTSRTLDGAVWPLQRTSTLMATLKGELVVYPFCGTDYDVTCVGVLTQPNSPDYRLDTNQLPVPPVQVGETQIDSNMWTPPLNASPPGQQVNGIDMTEPRVPSHILRDLSEFGTLAIITSFDGGTVGAVLSTYAAQIKLKCPHPSLAKACRCGRPRRLAS